MLSTPESDIPFPLSLSGEQKDVVEQLRDSQEASTTSFLWNTNTSLFSSQNVSAIVQDASWFGDLDNESFHDVSGDDASSLEWTPHISKSHSTRLVSKTSDTTFIGNENKSSVETQTVVAKNKMNQDCMVGAVTTVTPDHKKEKESKEDKDKETDTAAQVSNNTNKKSPSTEHVVVASNDHRDSSKTATPVGTNNNKERTTADTPTRATQKSLEKKAFSWFRSRRKDDSSSSSQTVLVHKKDIATSKYEETRNAPVTNELRQTTSSLNNTTTVNQQHDVATNATHAQDNDTNTTFQKSTNNSTTTTTSKDDKSSLQEQDIVETVTSNPVEIAPVVMVSTDSMDSQQTVKKDIEGIVAQAGFIAHVVSTDSTDSSRVVHVPKDLVGTVSEKPGTSTVDAPSTTNKVASIVEWIEKGFVSGRSYDATVAAVKDKAETNTTVQKLSAVEDSPISKDATPDTVKDASNKWTELNDENKCKQQEKVEDAAPDALNAVSTDSSDSIVVLSTSHSLSASPIKETGSASDEKVTLSNDETCAGVDKQDGDDAVVPVVVAGAAAATSDAVVAAEVVGANKGTKHAARNPSPMSIFRRLGSPKRKSPNNSDKDLPLNVKTTFTDDKALMMKSTDGKESVIKDSLSSQKNGSSVKGTSDNETPTKTTGSDEANPTLAANAVVISETATPKPADSSHVETSDNETRHASGEDVMKSSVQESEKVKDVAVAGDTVAVGAVAAVESGTTATTAKSASNQAAERAAKKKAFYWFGLRRSHSEKGLDKDTANAAEFDKDDASNVGKVAQGAVETTTKDKEPAGNWTSFDNANVFKADRAPEGDVLAAAAIPIPSDNVDQSHSVKEPNVDSSVDDKEEDTAMAAAGVATVAIAKGTPAKNVEAEQALMEKASRWFGLRRSNSEKSIQKKEMADTTKENGVTVESDKELATTNGTTRDWADFDGANVLKADRASHDSLMAAAAIPLPHDDPDELRTNEEFEKGPVVGMDGDSLAAPSDARAAAVSVAMGGDENAQQPTEDGMIEYFDEEAQPITESKKPLRSHCKCSRRCKIVLILLAHLVAAGIVLGIVLPMVLNGFWFDSDEPVPTVPAPLNPIPSPTSPGFLEPTAALVDPTQASFQQLLDEMISSVSFDGGAALRTPSTAQYLAYNWLSNSTFVGTYPDMKKIQRYALATLYYSSSGDSWDNNTGWLSDEDECTWFNTALGGFCSDDGTVVELDIMYNGLKGTIPEEIALLSLQELNLAGNDIVGPLPTTLGQMASLVDVMLWGNKINGILPSEIGLMVGLETLDLPMNALTGSIPTEVGLMTSLDWLSVSNNALNGTIPIEINRMPNLNNFYAYNNNFNGSFNCSQTITQCWVSCQKDDFDCRGL